jgi:hypothetical protein
MQLYEPGVNEFGGAWVNTTRWAVPRSWHKATTFFEDDDEDDTKNDLKIRLDRVPKPD